MLVSEYIENWVYLTALDRLRLKIGPSSKTDDEPSIEQAHWQKTERLLTFLRTYVPLE